jgi:peptidoglycan hydrolase-like protein with peptidoglycan-binding domain
MTRTASRIVVALVAAMGILLGMTGPAIAAINPNKWSENPELCRYGCSTNRKLIMFWQSILFSDDIGYQIPGHDDSFVDGGFGPKTEAATRRWQQSWRDRGWGLSVDGRVGPHTWNTANINQQSRCSPLGDGNYCTYYGDGRAFHWGVENMYGTPHWWFETPVSEVRYYLT